MARVTQVDAAICERLRTLARPTFRQDDRYLQRLVDRFWSHVDTSGECWLWTASVTGRGYGQLGWGPPSGRLVLVHRLSYVLHVGVIPAGLTIDHVRARGCMSRRCVRPEHLEAVTTRVNLLRGTGFAGRSARATHCPQGHPYDGQNTYRDRHGWRQCRACHSERERLRRSKALISPHPQPAGA
jgi:hypothetical protein